MLEKHSDPGVTSLSGRTRSLTYLTFSDGAKSRRSRCFDRSGASLEAKAAEVLSMDRVGLITDVDGTISRIVSEPTVAQIDPEIVESITRLVQQLSLVALLSGRSVDQLRQAINVDGLVCVGNHGLERWKDGQVRLVTGSSIYLDRVAVALSHIRNEVTLPGVIVENKGITGTIHYRLCPDHAAARRAILSASLDAARERNLRVAEGRKCVNLLPNVPFDKGTAVETLVRDHHLAGVIYLGDDSTDVDAFRALRRLANSEACQVLLVGVCAPESPDELHAEAHFCLPGVDAVATFLRRCSLFVQRAHNLDR